jgi:RNA polymerase sigma-70 factor (ECF subfamily)
MPAETHGAENVVQRALAHSRLGRQTRRALVNGAPGAVTVEGDVRHAVLGFTVSGGRIVEIDILADPERLARLDLSMLD